MFYKNYEAKRNEKNMITYKERMIELFTDKELDEKDKALLQNYLDKQKSVSIGTVYMLMAMVKKYYEV